MTSDVPLDLFESSAIVACLVMLRLTVAIVTLWQPLERIIDPELPSDDHANQRQIGRAAAFPSAAFHDNAWLTRRHFKKFQGHREVSLEGRTRRDTQPVV